MAEKVEEKDEFEGFEDQTTPEIDGWYKPELAYNASKKMGQIVHARVVGRITIENDDGERDVVLVKVFSPVKAQSTEEDRKEIELKKGDVLAVGIRYNLKELLSYVEHRGEVKFAATEKVKLKGGRTMWKFKFGGKGKKSAPPAPRALTGRDGESGELPF